MTTEFLVYLRLGVEHILDPRGYDHLLFIAVLTVMYRPRAWRQVVVLVTAFTLGHSATLALATFGAVRVRSELTELLIASTILATAVLNMVEVAWSRRREASKTPTSAGRLKYALALVFGLIHGLGFSNFLRAALGAGSAIATPLFAFNVGVELGQVTVVAFVLALGAFVTDRLGVGRHHWVVGVSGATAAVAVYIVGTRLPV